MLYLVGVFSPRAALHGFSGGGVRIHSSFVDAPSDRRIFIYWQFSMNFGGDCHIESEQKISLSADICFFIKDNIIT